MHVRSTAVILGLLILESPALAQVHTDLVAGFRASAIRTANGVAIPQVTSDAWTFRRATPDGFLLLPIANSGAFLGPYWGSSDRAFTVPLCGPVFSPVPAEDEVIFHDRAPSFRGIFMHPDSGLDAYSVFSPQSPVTITSLSGLAEVLGDVSNGVSVTVEARVNGQVITVVPPTTSTFSFTPNAVSLVSVPGVLPLTIGTGASVRDALWVRVNSEGSPSEDWCNVNIDLGIGSGVILGGPRDAAACGGSTTGFSVVTAGASLFRWQTFDLGLQAWRDLVEGETAGPSTYSGVSTDHLTIQSASADSQGRYRCRVDAGIPSGEARLTVCAADFNCDGDLNPDDLGDYITCYFTEPPCSRADYNGDADVNPDDLGDFITGYFGGCV